MRTSMFHIVEAGEQLTFLDQYQYVQCALRTVCLGKTLVMAVHFLHSTSSDEICAKKEFRASVYWTLIHWEGGGIGGSSCDVSSG